MRPQGILGTVASNERQRLLERARHRAQCVEKWNCTRVAKSNTQSRAARVHSFLAPMTTHACGHEPIIISLTFTSCGVQLVLRVRGFLRLGDARLPYNGCWCPVHARIHAWPHALSDRAKRHAMYMYPFTHACMIMFGWMTGNTLLLLDECVFCLFG